MHNLHKLIAIVILCLLPIQGYSFDALVKQNSDYVHPDADKDRKYVAKKGDIVDCRADGFFTSEGTSVFIILRVPGLSVADCRGKSISWRRVIDFEVVTHVPATDGYRVRAWGTKPGTGGLGNLTQANIEAWLTSWGATVFSSDSNEVVFDYKIYDMAISEGFWNKDVSLVVFSKFNYNSGTGVHVIEADYSATPWDAESVQKSLESKGVPIDSHAGGVIRYRVDRTSMNAYFKQASKDKLEHMIQFRQYYLDSDTVDSAIATGEITLTEAQFNAATSDNTTE
jgi:hypothetical protein